MPDKHVDLQLSVTRTSTSPSEAISEAASPIAEPAAPRRRRLDAITPEIPANESERLEALRQYRILDTEPEPTYDDIASLAAAICDTPIAVVSFTDAHRQWFKARVGLQAEGAPRDGTIFAHAIPTKDEVFEIPDTLKDRRFKRSPLIVDGRRIRFFAGAPLVTREGFGLGGLCVMDPEPRQLVQRERAALHSLARQIVAHLEMRKTIAELEERSMTDALTGAWNQRAFERRLSGEWGRHLRAAGSLALLRLDVDRFKQINEKLGDRAGYQVLVQVARTAERALRTSDFMARSGGDEFSILLPNTDLAGAKIVAERLCDAIGQIKSSQREVTASIGVAAIVPTADLEQDVLEASAAEKLARAKRAGRNRVEA